MIGLCQGTDSAQGILRMLQMINMLDMGKIHQMMLNSTQFYRNESETLSACVYLMESGISSTQELLIETQIVISFNFK